MGGGGGDIKLRDTLETISMRRYFYVLLYGLPKCELAKLQRVQNTTARLLTFTSAVLAGSPVGLLCNRKGLFSEPLLNFRVPKQTFSIKPTREPASEYSFTKRYDRITPVLRVLHWFPISYRIQFRILLLTHLKSATRNGPSLDYY